MLKRAISYYSFSTSIITVRLRSKLIKTPFLIDWITSLFSFHSSLSHCKITHSFPPTPAIIYCCFCFSLTTPRFAQQSLILMGSDGEVKNLKSFKIFVGYDSREDIAYQVCRYSLLKRASIPIEVLPLKLSELREMGVYWRERGKLESTEFSFSRFLTPYLANYEGWAMFVDCDFLYLDDIKKLVDLIDDKYAIMCVQHDYTPKEATKMDGAVQTVYPRKNWSSMVLYNCGNSKNKSLTPEVVNKESGSFLHRFQWLNDDEIGEIPFVWNFLVGHNEVVEGDDSTLPKALHFTLGGPWFEEWKDCEFGDIWLNELEDYNKAASADAASF